MPLLLFILKAQDVTLIQKVAASPKFKVDQFWLNGEPDLAIRNDPRFAAVVDGMFYVI